MEPQSNFVVDLGFAFLRENGWKQPGDNHQNRFSRVIHHREGMKKLVTVALQHLGAVGGLESTKVNPNAPAWAKQVIASIKEGTKVDCGFSMAGTERTFKYVVVALTPKGRVGYRDLGNELFRVRVEPQNGSTAELGTNFLRENGWKQPGDNNQNRFSRVLNLNGPDNVIEVVRLSLLALGEEDGVVFNPNAPAWAKQPATIVEEPQS
ncbi:MAG: hypothetical protein NTU97_00125 [Candidatus Magasanikbacteria bacterium]|nr:hypothetical protein [Candidatus Magasanikbacteria bacterium]